MDEIIVWGAGNRGKDVINVMGADCIVAIVDSDPKKWNSDVWGIAIISPEELYSFYSDNVVIVTPEGHEKSIEEDLHSRGVYHTFLYDSDFHAIETYLKQINMDVLFSKYDKNKKQYVYGLSLLGVLMYEDFISRGFQCEMIIQDDLDVNVSKALISKFQISTCSDPDKGQIHFSVGNKYAGRFDDSDSFLELCDGDYFVNDSLKRFKNSSLGKRCFIIGTGPSLRISDLDTLWENKEISIGVNGIYKSFEYTRWRPDYYMVADLDAVHYGKQNIIDMDVDCKFVADVAWDFDGVPGIYKWHLDRRWDLYKEPKFSDDFSKVSYAGLTITYDGALQLAAYMGFSEIYLLGIDCSNYSSNRTAHFFDELGKENKKETGFLQVDANILAYKSARRYAEKNGFKIYNATRGGKLEVFERRDFDSLFDREMEI